jgi:hypothetical protein
LDNWDSVSVSSYDCFLFATVFRLALRPIQGALRAPFAEVKQMENEYGNHLCLVPKLRMCGAIPLHPLSQRLSNCGPRQFARWTAGGFRRKIIAKTVSDTEQMKIHPYMSVLKLPL